MLEPFVPTLNVGRNLQRRTSDVCPVGHQYRTWQLIVVQVRRHVLYEAGHLFQHRLKRPPQTEIGPNAIPTGCESSHDLRAIRGSPAKQARTIVAAEVVLEDRELLPDDEVLHACTSHDLGHL